MSHGFEQGDVMRLRFEFDFKTAVVALAAVLFLSGLGTWQVQRLHWKEGLIADLQAQMALPPQPLPEIVDSRDWTFRRASVTGTFNHEREMLLRPRMQDGIAGVEIITPLTRVSGGTVLIDRGWIREEDVKNAPRPQGIVHVLGLVRGNFEKEFFTPDNDPSKGQWYWVDIPAMTSGMAEALPVVLFAPDDGNKILIGGQGVPVLPNDHLQYAFFWFVMAFTLSVIYVVFSISRADEDDDSIPKA